MIDLFDKDDKDNFPLLPEVEAQLNLGSQARNEIKFIFEKVIADLKSSEPNTMSWLNAEWIDRIISFAPKNFNFSLDRWRRLYIAVQKQLYYHSVFCTGSML